MWTGHLLADFVLTGDLWKEPTQGPEEACTAAESSRRFKTGKTLRLRGIPGDVASGSNSLIRKYRKPVLIEKSGSLVRNYVLLQPFGSFDY